MTVRLAGENVASRSGVVHILEVSHSEGCISGSVRVVPRIPRACAPLVTWEKWVVGVVSAQLRRRCSRCHGQEAWWIPGPFTCQFQVVEHPVLLVPALQEHASEAAVLGLDVLAQGIVASVGKGLEGHLRGAGVAVGDGHEGEVGVALDLLGPLREDLPEAVGARAALEAG